MAKPKIKTPTFNPDHALRNILASAKSVASEDPENDPDSAIGIVDMAELAQGMADSARELDKWIRKGGRLPRRWATLPKKRAA
jgi:uncharacterized protein with PhoU and TrkA domain